ncbi:MAG: family 78 glycoside hydrolase catalytic domain [Lentisphaerota bacterium]
MTLTDTMESQSLQPKNLWGSRKDSGFLRKRFKLNALPASAFMRIFVDTGYELYFNGRFIAGVDEWNNARDYDVLPYLVAGNNLIAVKLLNHGGHRGFAFELNVYAETIVVSDASWTAAPEERWGWKTLEFDDTKWDKARVLNLEQSGDRQWNGQPGDGEVKLVPNLDCSVFFNSSIPKCSDSPFFHSQKFDEKVPPEVLDIIGQEYQDSINLFPAEVLFPVKIYDACSGNGMLENAEGILGKSGHPLIAVAPRSFGGPSVIVDFGEETAGFLRLKTKSEGNVHLRLLYGETLNECYHLPSRDMLLRQMVTENVNICSGHQEWESNSRQGFRFVKVEFEDCLLPVEVEAIAVRASIYQTPYAGYFSCSDVLLNKIWQSGRRTLHLCMQEYYLDGIKRDRFLWTGDTRLEALINYYAFGDTALFKYCWKKLAEVQYADGAIPSVYGLGAPVLWDYVAWWLIAFDDYYLHTGDIEFPRVMKTSIIRAIDWMISKSGEDGLIDVPVNKTEGWMCVLNKQSGRDLMLNFLFYRSLRTVANLMHETGETALAKYYEGLAGQTMDAFNKLQNSPGLKVFAPSFGHLASGAIEGFEVIESHFRNNRDIEGINFIREYWGDMIKSGGDTLWEAPIKSSGFRIDKIGDGFDSLSRCHGWTAGPTYALLSEVLGIKPITPGFKEFEVKPQFGDLTFARGVVPTPAGFIVACFKKENHYFGGVLHIPNECRAKIGLPFSGRNAKIVVDGQNINFELDNGFAWFAIDKPGTHSLKIEWE